MPVQGWLLASSDRKDAVKEQLDRLLLDPSFQRSKRYPSLLRFLVFRTLDGEADSLKERILGIEVFGRRPDYDTNEDPIVRVTVAEVRKRIQKYYEDPRHKNELHIALPTGSYVPVFEFPADSSAYSPALGEEQSSGSAPPTGTVPGASTTTNDTPLRVVQSSVSSPTIRKAIAIGAVLTLAIILSMTLWGVRKRSILDAFWGPVLNSANPILLCIADQPRKDPHPMNAYHPELQGGEGDKGSIIYADNVPFLVDMTKMITSRGRSYKVQVQGQTTLTDLAGGPVVLMGGSNNIWTLRLTQPLRFHFGNDPMVTQYWIEDSAAPARRDWLRPVVPPQGPFKDYALVARFADPYTRQMTVVIAGLGHTGMVAAVNFVLSPQYLSELDRRAPSNWRNKNIEVVLETMVVNGYAGSPLIDAVYTW